MNLHLLVPHFGGYHSHLFVAFLAGWKTESTPQTILMSVEPLLKLSGAPALPFVKVLHFSAQDVTFFCSTGLCLLQELIHGSSFGFIWQASLKIRMKNAEDWIHCPSRYTAPWWPVWAQPSEARTMQTRTEKEHKLTTSKHLQATQSAFSRWITMNFNVPLDPTAPSAHILV